MKQHSKLSDLLTDESRFQDLLYFKRKEPITRRVLSDTNPLLTEIRAKLSDPSQREQMLTKSLLLRNPSATKRNKVGNSLKTNDVRRMIKDERNIPTVPLHKMDKLTHDIAQHLLKEVEN